MRADTIQHARILIVDDEAANIQLLENVLDREDYRNVVSTTNSQEVLALYTSFEPDLILLDLLMPHLDGFAVLEQLHRRIPEGTYLPILVLTADITAQARRRALSLGAKDFLTKPFDIVEVVMRIGNLLEARFLYLELQKYISLDKLKRCFSLVCTQSIKPCGSWRRLPMPGFTSIWTSQWT